MAFLCFSFYLILSKARAVLNGAVFALSFLGGEFMSVIKLHTANERLIFDSKPVITSGNIDIDSISVTLCRNWRQVGERADIWAVFYRDENEKLKRKLENGSCMIPSEMLLERGLFYFGIYAENENGKKIKTSKIAEYEVKQGIATKAEAESNLIKTAIAGVKQSLENLLETITGEENPDKNINELTEDIKITFNEIERVIDESGVIQYDNSFVEDQNLD